MEDLLLIISLISLGFFGGFTHCIGMCGPFVITQVSNRLQKIPIEDFTFVKKTFELSLIPYHLGRATTYSLIGLTLASISQNVKDGISFRYFTAFILSFAVLFFINILFDEKPGKLFRKIFKARSPSKFLTKLKFIKLPFDKMMSNPKGINGYFLGLALGFLPCGLLYGAFLIAASFSNPFLAMAGMFAFGLSNFPALFIAGFGGSLIKKLPEFKIIFKIFILINIALLTKVILNSI